MMRLNAYEAFLTSIRCIGIGAATFRPTEPAPDPSKSRRPRSDTVSKLRMAGHRTTGI